MTVFEINILSDFVCPWCYIGKRRLDKAIRLYQKTYQGGSLDTFVLSWEPYYLDPDAPHVGIPWAERLAAKYDHERAQAVKGRLRQLGLGEGISFSFDCRIGSTRDAHRLIELAKTKEVEMQTVIMDGLFEAYFERDADITDLALLSKVGVAAGLDRREVTNYLESDRGGQEVDEQAKTAKNGHGSGVPRYTIQGKYKIDGAEEPSAFLDVFQQVKSEETAAQSEDGDQVHVAIR